MKTIILLWLSLEVFQAQTAFLGPGDSPLKQKVVSGTMDDRGICHCSLAIQDFMFPAERVEFLETANLNLSLRFQKEIDKIQDYQHKLDIYIENIRNLTSRVELCDTESITDNLHFEMLKLEISELESLVIELKSSLTGSNDKVKALYLEVENISFMVNQLERHDKNNILKVRRDIGVIQKRLDECKQDQAPFQKQFDTCEHGGIINISKPQIVQISFKGIYHTTGGWGKESLFGTPKELYWVLSSDSNSVFNSVRLYRTYEDLRQYKSFKDQSISGIGSGLVLYNNSLYYHCHNQDICKVNLDTNKIDRKSLLHGATKYSYVATRYEYIDLEGDEYGLWILYARENVLGSMVIGQLNETTLDLIKTWTTSIYKPSVTNAFMVCGVMYAVRTISTTEEEIFYRYDTNTGEEQYVKIPFEKVHGKVNIQSLSYNANDQKLYMYNEGFEVLYDIRFKPQTKGKS